MFIVHIYLQQWLYLFLIVNKDSCWRLIVSSTGFTVPDLNSETADGFWFFGGEMLCLALFIRKFNILCIILKEKYI